MFIALDHCRLLDYASIRWKIPWRDDGMMPTPGAGENTGEPPELPTELEVPSEVAAG